MVSHTEAKARRSQRALARLDIPEKMRGVTLDDLDHDDDNNLAMAQAKAWYADYRRYFKGGEEPGKGLLLWGPPGIGKTIIVTALLQALVGDGARGAFIRMDRWRTLKGEEMSAQQAWSKFGDPSAYDEWLAIEDRLRRIRDAHVLGFDDVGTEYRSDFTSKLFVDLLRDRYTSGRPTFMTSNLAPSQWGADYGPATKSFIHEAFFVLPVTGKDRRRGGR